MLGDFAAPADPDPVVAQDVIDETGKRGGARRLASETAMHSDGHHLGRQTGSALFPRPQWPLLSSTRQVSVKARRCATPCPIPALRSSAAEQSCKRNLPSREQGLGLRRARRHRIRDSLGRKASRPITSADYNSNFSQDRLGFGEVMAGQLASQRSGNHAVLQAGSMMV